MSNWIINRSTDLKCFFGASLVSLLALVSYQALIRIVGMDSMNAYMYIFAIWVLLFDSPHLFATLARTYADRRFFNENQGLVGMSLFVIFIPLGLRWSILQVDQAIAHLFTALVNIFGMFFAYWHLCRQHWGIFRAYALKAQSADSGIIKADAALMTLLLCTPFCYAFGRDLLSMFSGGSLSLIGMKSWETLLILMLQLGAGIQLLSFICKQFLLIHTTKVLTTTANALLGTGLIGEMTCSLDWKAIYNDCLPWIGALFLSAALGLLYRLYHEYLRQKHCSQRNLFLLTVAGLHTLVLLSPVNTGVALVCLTFYHNLQYLRLVNHYCEHRYAFRASQDHGLAHRFSTARGLATGAILFSLLLFIPRAGNGFSFYFIPPALYDPLQLIFWGIAFNHYYLDAVIWKLSDKTLKSELLQLH